MRAVFVALFAVVLASGPAGAGPAEDWEGKFNTGLDAEGRGDLLAAERSFEGALVDAEKLAQESILITTMLRMADRDAEVATTDARAEHIRSSCSARVQR